MAKTADADRRWAATIIQDDMPAATYYFKGVHPDSWLISQPLGMCFARVTEMSPSRFDAIVVDAQRRGTTLIVVDSIHQP